MPLWERRSLSHCRRPGGDGGRERAGMEMRAESLGEQGPAWQRALLFPAASAVLARAPGRAPSRRAEQTCSVAMATSLPGYPRGWGLQESNVGPGVGSEGHRHTKPRPGEDGPAGLEGPSEAKRATLGVKSHHLGLLCWEMRRPCPDVPLGSGEGPKVQHRGHPLGDWKI